MSGLSGLIRPIFSVVGSTLFANFLRSSKELPSFRAKYDFVVKQSDLKSGEYLLSGLSDFERALMDFSGLVLMYVQQLHESSDAKGVCLFTNKYDHLEGEDFSSLIDQWTLKPRKVADGSIN